jgi:dTDP-4-amino-4,6-dideoxygalactose transaminase
MVTTHSSELAERLRMLRNHGSRKQYHHDELGFNSRLDELQAALLRIKLRYIDRYNAERKQVADWYQKGLEGADILLPFGQQHVFHQYTVRVDERDQLKDYLADHNVASAVYYPVPLDKQKAFSEIPDRHDLFVSEQTSRCCLSLPIFPGMQERQVKRVVSLIHDYLKPAYRPDYLLSEVLS